MLAPAPAAEAMVQFEHEVAPNPAHAARYDDLFAVYANLYPQLRGAYAQLAATQPDRGNLDMTEPNTRPVVIIGAGKIARGYVGHLVALSGRADLFVEVNETVVRAHQ